MHHSPAILWSICCALSMATMLALPAKAEPAFSTFEELPQPACIGPISEHIGHGAKYVLNGTRVTLYPQMADGEYDTKNAFVYQMTGVIENRRNYTHPDDTCDSANEVVQILDITLCSCTRAPFLRQTADYKDVGYQFMISDCPEHLNLVITTSLSITDNQYTDHYGPTMNGSNYPTFDYLHPAGGMKIGLNISGWQWASSEMANETFISVGFLFAVQVAQDGVILQNVTDYANLISVYTPPYSLALNMERGIFLNGIPSIDGNAHPDRRPIPFYSIQGFWLGLYDAISFCSPRSTIYQKWDHIGYDPSFVSLFTPDISPDSSPSSAQQSRRWVVPVAVSVSVVVVLIVAAIVLAAVFVPSVRNFFRPFSARSQNVGHNSVATRNTEEPQQGWKRAVTSKSS